MPAILARDLTPRRLLAVARESAATVLPTVPFLIDVLGRSTHGGQGAVAAARDLGGRVAAGDRARALRGARSACGRAPSTARPSAAASPSIAKATASCPTAASARRSTASASCSPIPTRTASAACACTARRSATVVPSRVRPATPRATTSSSRAGDSSPRISAASTTRGRLQLVGRVREVVNVGGRKVYPAEIERVIRDVPGVIDVVVSGVARSSVADALRALVAADRARLARGHRRRVRAAARPLQGAALDRDRSRAAAHGARQSWTVADWTPGIPLAKARASRPVPA